MCKRKLILDTRRISLERSNSEFAFPKPAMETAEQCKKYVQTGVFVNFEQISYSNVPMFYSEQENAGWADVLN